jgi:hypothetical protein
MSEMVERVAKAQAGSRWEMFDEEHRNAARKLAREAIAAMREPTLEMSLAVPTIQPWMWRAMIDEALR